MTLIIAACDKPEAKPPTNIEKDDKADTDTDSEGESSGGNTGKMGEDSGSGSEGETNTDGGDSGSGSEGTTLAHSFAFDTASHKVAFTSGGTYTKAVVETNKPAGDTRNIEYTSSENAIATVNGEGVVTFVTQGTVTITATKALKGEYAEATARYTLYLTTKPVTKVALVTEITRATGVHGNTVDLNYIDTSEITNMSELFRDDINFNGKVDKWDTSSVTDMNSMFRGATAFNQSLNSWDVSSVANMSAMFRDAITFNQPLNSWTVSEVTDMSVMFYEATAFNQPLNSWTVSSVTTMAAMFSGAKAFNKPLNNWDVSSVTNMISMFQSASSFNQDLTAWVAKSGRVSNFMFLEATAMQTVNKPGWAR